MLLQRREGGALHVFSQHDHGLLSGELARRWHEPSRLSLSTSLAIALHDIGWQPLDAIEGRDPATLAFDPARGQPHDFLTLPSAYKIPAYEAGISRVEAIDPYAGLLLSHHFSAFVSAEYAAFTAREAARRARLATALNLDAPDTPEVLADFERLKFFDLLSLYICLSAPGALPEHLPPWLPDRYTCDGTTYTLGWLEPGVLAMRPFGYTEPRSLQILHRALHVSRFEDARDFLDHAQRAPLTPWSVRIVPG